MHFAILAPSMMICRRLGWVIQGVPSYWLGFLGTFGGSEGSIKPCSIEPEAGTGHQSQAHSLEIG